MRDYEYEEKLADPARIVICIEGGLVQWTAATEPVKVVVIDLDTEGASENELTEVMSRDGPALAFTQILDVQNFVDPNLVNNIFREILADQ